MTQFMRGQETREGQAISKSSPPRIYRRTISSTSSARQETAAEPTALLDASTHPYAVSTNPASNPSAVSIPSTDAAPQKTRTRQPMKRRTQRSHTDQSFAQRAPIASTEYEGLKLDDEELEAYAAESDSLVQALTLSTSQKAKGASGVHLDKTRGSKTLLKAKGQSREKGLDKGQSREKGLDKRSKSRRASCSQQ